MTIKWTIAANAAMLHVNLFGIFGLQTILIATLPDRTGGAKKLSRHSNPWLLHPGDPSHLPVVPFFSSKKNKTCTHYLCHNLIS